MGRNEMIEKVKEGFKISCNRCGFHETIDTHDDMEVFKEIIRETGWASHRRCKNFCEDCQEEMRKGK
jgi:hypothetical protein